MVDYPNVPDLPGVPTLYRDPNETQTTVDYSTSDTTAGGDTTTQKWGLFTSDGGVALEVDSVVEVDYNKEFNIPAYPIEDGSFESYNKVEVPYEATLIVTKMGTDSERSNFQNTLNTLLGSLDLVDIWTPDRTYSNANVVGVKIARTAQRGANMIVAEIHLKEIRVGTAAQFTNTKSDNAANQTDTGAVQGQTPSTSTTASAAGENTIGN